MPTEHIVTFIWGGAALLTLAVGATAPRYRSVIWRTLLLYLAAMFTSIWITGAIKRDFSFGGLMGVESWSENIGWCAGILIWSSIAWAAARWRRRGHEIREEKRRQETLMLKMLRRNGVHSPELRAADGRLSER